MNEMPTLMQDASVSAAVAAARIAQVAWAGRLPRQRLRPLAELPAELCQHWEDFVALSPRPNASPSEVLSSEVMPLAEACRYAARVGKRALAPRTHSLRHAAWWMGRIGVRVTRQPWGTVLILAPSNYPLLLPGVQIVQALAAGNAVVVKPAPGCTAILQRFVDSCAVVGIPPGLIQVLDTPVAAGQAAIAAGVDKVVLTGSVDSGRSVLSQLAQTLTPATLELSGCDAVFVTEQADLQRVARCVVYGLLLNGGATCIAPRRVFVTPLHRERLGELIREELQQRAAAEMQLPRAVRSRIAQAAQQAVAEGAEVLCGSLDFADRQPASMPALVLHKVQPHMAIAQGDFFGPVLSLISVPNMAAAIEADRLCPYALGASVFGPTVMAEHWASQIQAGCVVINDVIVPTADPRVAFGGGRHSGWGVTRGWEGLVAMSRPQVMCIRRGRWLPHLDQRQAHNSRLLVGLLQMSHAPRLTQRLAAAGQVLSALLRPPAAPDQPPPTTDPS